METSADGFTIDPPSSTNLSVKFIYKGLRRRGLNHDKNINKIFQKFAPIDKNLRVSMGASSWDSTKINQITSGELLDGDENVLMEMRRIPIQPYGCEDEYYSYQFSCTKNTPKELLDAMQEVIKKDSCTKNVPKELLDAVQEEL